jgi:hypothetical protein
MVVRDKNGHFSNPVFVALTGGSFGWQAGVQSTDVVLVFTTRTGVEGITGGKVTLGADASVAAGPVGRQASIATDSNFNAEVYSYSRNRGLFAGIALDGSVLSIDRTANAEFYKKPGVTASDIMDGDVKTTDNTAQRFLAAISAHHGRLRTGHRCRAFCVRGTRALGRGADVPDGRSEAGGRAQVTRIRGGQTAAAQRALPLRALWLTAKNQSRSLRSFWGNGGRDAVAGRLFGLVERLVGAAGEVFNRICGDRLGNPD